MTQRKESALGRGLDALIRPEISSKDNQESAKKEVKAKNTPKRRKPKVKETPKSPNKTSKTKSQDKVVEVPEKNVSTVDETLVENVIMEVHKNPRISLWSARSAAVLRLLKKTKPEFSISKEASALIEDAVKDKYPELWEAFEDKDI